MFCTKCGEMLLEDSKFCTSCGASCVQENAQVFIDTTFSQTRKLKKNSSLKKRGIILLNLGFLISFLAKIFIYCIVYIDIRDLFSGDFDWLTYYVYNPTEYFDMMFFFGFFFSIIRYVFATLSVVCFVLDKKNISDGFLINTQKNSDNNISMKFDIALLIVCILYIMPFILNEIGEINRTKEFDCIFGVITIILRLVLNIYFWLTSIRVIKYEYQSNNFFPRIIIKYIGAILISC